VDIHTEFCVVVTVVYNMYVVLYVCIVFMYISTLYAKQYEWVIQ